MDVPQLPAPLSFAAAVAGCASGALVACVAGRMALLAFWLVGSVGAAAPPSAEARVVLP